MGHSLSKGRKLLPSLNSPKNLKNIKTGNSLITELIHWKRLRKYQLISQVSYDDYSRKHSVSLQLIVVCWGPTEPVPTRLFVLPSDPGWRFSGIHIYTQSPTHAVAVMNPKSQTKRRSLLTMSLIRRLSFRKKRPPRAVSLCHNLFLMF